jgi:chromosome segregation ATPase
MKSVPHEASASKMQASSYDDELRELVMKHERLISQEQAGALPPADLENRLSSRSSEELESKHSATLSAQSDRLRRVDADMTRLHTSLHQRHSDIRERVLSLEKSHDMDKDKNEVACRNVSIFGDKLTDLNARVHEMEEALKASHGEKNKMHERMSTLHSMHDQLQSRLLDTSISGSEARASFGLGEDEQPASRQVLEQVSKLET